MSSNKIKDIIDQKFDNICKECAFHWITCLWGRYDESFSFSENKEAFFYLLRRLLTEGYVIFDHPNGSGLWMEEPDLIVEYFAHKWPKHVKSEDDIDLVVYFYQMPAVSWCDQDGEWRGS